MEMVKAQGGAPVAHATIVSVYPGSTLGWILEALCMYFLGPLQQSCIVGASYSCFTEEKQRLTEVRKSQSWD